MADSGALRQRRSRLHKAGNHSLCRSNCSSAPRLHSVPAGARTEPRPAAEALDATAELANLAVRLRAAHEESPGDALIARELRMTLQALLPAAKPAVDSDLASLFEDFAT